jgi:hypothetical protein
VLKIRKIGLTQKRKHNRILYLQKKYEKRVDKETWRINRYKSFVNVVSTNYMMTNWQKIRAKNIIETFPETHISKIPYTYEEIVTSICLYVMKEDGRGRELRFNKDFLISIGLTRDKYEVISENLQSLPELPE